MRFVDDRPVKEGVVAFLQKQHRARRKKVRQATASALLCVASVVATRVCVHVSMMQRQV